MAYQQKYVCLATKIKEHLLIGEDHGGRFKDSINMGDVMQVSVLMGTGEKITPVVNKANCWSNGSQAQGKQQNSLWPADNHRAEGWMID